MQSRRGHGSCKAPGCTNRDPQGALHLIPSAPGYSSGPPGCGVLPGGGCSRKRRQAGPDHWDGSQPLSRPGAPPGIQEGAVQATSPRASRPWARTVTLAASRLPQPTSPRSVLGDPEALRSYRGRRSSPQARPRAVLSQEARPRPPNSRPFAGTAPPS